MLDSCVWGVSVLAFLVIAVVTGSNVVVTVSVVVIVVVIVVVVNVESQRVP